MQASQFGKLIQAVTGRPLTLSIDVGEVPLESTVTVFRPRKLGETVRAFEWKTPKKEDSLLRSFITAFSSKYLEPDPETYSRNCPAYGDTWKRHADAWESPETHWNCALWGHHTSHMTSREKLRKQVEANFSGFDSALGRLGFYETNYGIGLFTVYGGSWVKASLNEMAKHLESHGIPFKNELSEAGWVTRFLIGLEKPDHYRILGSF
jgi:hypothetical protein